jgi:hypothetical protein
MGFPYTEEEKTTKKQQKEGFFFNFILQNISHDNGWSLTCILTIMAKLWLNLFLLSNMESWKIEFIQPAADATIQENSINTESNGEITSPSDWGKMGGKSEEEQVAGPKSLPSAEVHEILQLVCQPIGRE